MRSIKLWLGLLASLLILAAVAGGSFYWQHQQAQEDDRIAKMNFEDVWSAYQAGQYRTAFRGAQRLAGGGSSRAQVLLGRMYGSGQGIPEDQAQALNWYLRAADGEHPEAMFAVVRYYGSGIGLEHRNPYGAAHWALRLAEKGDARGQAYIGRAYIEGFGVTKDPEQGREWLLRAARAGNAQAMSRLARAFWSGELGEQDYESALHWYLAGARFGYSPSMLSAVRMLKSEALPVFDLEQAYFWAIVGTAWFPERPMNPDHLEILILDILFQVPDDLPPRPPLVDVSGLTGGPPSSRVSLPGVPSWYEHLMERAAVDPSLDLSPDGFDQGWRRRLDPETQSRLMTEIREYLAEYPEPPMTM